MAFRILVQVICLWADRAVSELDLLLRKLRLYENKDQSLKWCLPSFPP